VSTDNVKQDGTLKTQSCQSITQAISINAYVECPPTTSSYSPMDSVGVLVELLLDISAFDTCAETVWGRQPTLGIVL
jgi:hypothetical protein